MALSFSACGKKAEYSGEIDFFGTDVSWDMTVADTYEYVSEYVFEFNENDEYLSELVPELYEARVNPGYESVGDSVSNNDIEFVFNENGILKMIHVDMGEDSATSDFAVSWLGEPDKEKDGSYYWYGTLGGYDTMAYVWKNVTNYVLTFELHDEEKLAEKGIRVSDMYDEATAALSTNDFETASEILSFLAKIEYRDSVELYNSIDAKWMAYYMEQGDYENAWSKYLLAKNVDSETVRECAYELACIYLLEGSNDKRFEAAELLETYCEGYRDTQQLLDYNFARSLEIGNIALALPYYKKLPADLLDVSQRIETIESYSKWFGTYICTSYDGEEQKFDVLEINLSITDGTVAAAVTCDYLDEIAPVGGMYSTTFVVDAAGFAESEAFTAIPAAHPKYEFTFSVEKITLKLTESDGAEESYVFSLLAVAE